jgi:hypothetical protein
MCLREIGTSQDRSDDIECDSIIAYRIKTVGVIVMASFGQNNPQQLEMEHFKKLAVLGDGKEEVL